MTLGVVITVGLDWPGRVHWQWPWALALVAVPVVLAFVRSRIGGGRVLMPVEQIDERPPASLRQRFLWLPRALGLGATACLIVALARPQVGEGKVLTSTDAVAIQVVIDRSGSMGRQMDLSGTVLSRLEAVKRVLREFLIGNGRELTGRASDLIGLVVFARFAETACPLVRDHRAVVQLVDGLQPAQQRYEDGTAIGDGLALAAARLKTAEDDLRSRHSAEMPDDFRIKTKVIVLLTDGDNNAGEHEPLESARLCAGWGIKVYTIGIGGGGYQIFRTPFGTERLPIPDEIDEGSLQRIAEATGGLYFRARDGDALRNICGEIDRLERSSVKVFDYLEYRELFQGFGVAACALLAAQVVLGATLLRRTGA